MARLINQVKGEGALEVPGAYLVPVEWTSEGRSRSGRWAWPLYSGRDDHSASARWRPRRESRAGRESGRKENATLKGSVGKVSWLTVQGGSRYRLGPITWLGDARSLKIGSVKTDILSNSTRRVEWPSQVMRKALSGAAHLMLGSKRGKTKFKS